MVVNSLNIIENHIAHENNEVPVALCKVSYLLLIYQIVMLLIEFDIVYY